MTSRSQASSGQVALEARNVYKVFVPSRGLRFQPLLALRAINLTVSKGEFVALVGPSGCGKSTLLNIFAGLTPPTHGEALHDGSPIHTINSRVGYVTQDDNLLPWRTALANVELPFELKGMERRHRRQLAGDYLQRVGLSGFEHHFPQELSGGMRKRVAIARTLADESTNVILMDEPFGSLDAQTRLVLQDQLLTLLQGTKRAVVFVTHDIIEAIALADRIALFTSSPASIKSIFEVAIPRPRDVFHIHSASGFAQIYDAIWEGLHEEIAKIWEVRQG